MMPSCTPTSVQLDRCPDKVEELAPEGFEVDGHELILFGRYATRR